MYEPSLLPIFSYVLASYAKFLWDVEEDEDKECQQKTDLCHAYPLHLFEE